MRKSILLISVLAVSIAASAAVVTPEKAMQVAQSFVPVQKTSKKNAQGVAATTPSSIVYTHYMPKSGRPAIYVVNVGNAFAVISADDVAHPILGYNYSKSWPTDGNIPPQINAFFDDLAQQMEAASEYPQDPEIAAEWRNPSKRKATKRTKTNNLPDSVGPLLTTTWSQQPYYNELCPADEGSTNGHALTGCVATAMAQIINYWGKQGLIHTRGIHSYESTYGTLTVNYDTTTYDFAHMPDSLTSESTPQEVNAVAKLMYHCGVAANMTYGASGSGAYDQDARAALINFFQVSPDASHAERQFMSDEEWDELLKNEIAAGRPVLYSGSSPKGGAHAFVCNGYKQGGYFYFNFGWGGAADGWYISSIARSFPDKQGVIVGIEPLSNSHVILGQTASSSTFVADEPLEFYHTLGLNKYDERNYTKLDSNYVTFITSDVDNPLVVEVAELEYQAVSIFDGQTTDSAAWLRDLQSQAICDISPIVSSSSAVTLLYQGRLQNLGFRLLINHAQDCHIPNNLSFKNVLQDTTNALLVDWSEYGSAAQWQIRYKRHDSEDEYSTLITDSHPVTITGIPIGYLYDVDIRSICGEGDTSKWCTANYAYVDIPYWTDVVTEQPAGYLEDEDGNVSISSAEGLAWLAVMVNGFHDNSPHSFEGKTVTLTADINLEGYRWFPMGQCINWQLTQFSGTFDGQGHAISNIYVRDTGSLLGLFGRVQGGTIRNVKIVGGTVSSTCDELPNDIQYWLPCSRIGGLVGFASQCPEISNCHSSANVSGWGIAGSLCGTVDTDEEGGSTRVFNCSATGSVMGRDVCGGLIGSVWGHLEGEVNVHIDNCYSRGDVFIADYDYYPRQYGRGGLIGLMFYGTELNNSYATGTVYTDEYYDANFGCITGYQKGAHTHYLYAADSVNIDMPLIGLQDEDVADTTRFHHAGNANTLAIPVTIAATPYTDLLAALNAWVDANNAEGSYCHWTADTENVNGGFPIFDCQDNPESINNTDANANANAVKIFRNAQILIRRGDRLYTLQGQQLK